jgi:hypothetical protein
MKQRRNARFLREAPPIEPFDEAAWQREANGKYHRRMGFRSRRKFLRELEAKVKARSYYFEDYVLRGIWVSECFIIRLVEGERARRVRIGTDYCDVLGRSYVRLESGLPLLCSPLKWRLGRIHRLLREHEGTGEEK